MSEDYTRANRIGTPPFPFTWEVTAEVLKKKLAEDGRNVWADCYIKRAELIVKSDPKDSGDVSHLEDKVVKVHVPHPLVDIISKGDFYTMMLRYTGNDSYRLTGAKPLLESAE